MSLTCYLTEISAWRIKSLKIDLFVMVRSLFLWIHFRMKILATWETFIVTFIVITSINNKYLNTSCKHHWAIQFMTASLSANPVNHLRGLSPSAFPGENPMPSKHCINWYVSLCFGFFRRSRLLTVSSISRWRLSVALIFLLCGIVYTT